MMKGFPVFKGKDTTDQLLQIVKVIGTPTSAQLARIIAENVGGWFPLHYMISYILQEGVRPKAFSQHRNVLFSQVLPGASPQGSTSSRTSSGFRNSPGYAALDLVVRLLKFDPKERTSAADALALDFFRVQGRDETK